MKKIIIRFLILGLALRLILGFSTYHSDIVPFDFAGKLISQGNIKNFYDYLWELPEEHPVLNVYPRNLFNYPPLPYFFLGGMSAITTGFFDPILHENFLIDFASVLGDIRTNWLLLILKLPYLIFDLGIGFVLMRFFKKEKEKILAFALWIFNPVNLYATYMIGQFDIIPTFLSLLALFFVLKNKGGEKFFYLFLAAVMLGLGAGFKIFPILFIVPLSLLRKDWIGRITTASIGFFVYFLVSFPFIFSQGFRRTALLAGQTTKSFYAQIPISGGESIILFLVSVVFFYFIFLYKNPNFKNLWKYFFIMLMIFFIFTHFHPQWFLWITPFIVIDLVKSRFRHILLYVAVFVSYLLMITFFDPGLSIGLFSPINKNLYIAPGFWQTLNLNLDINTSRSILHSILVGVFSYLIYYHFPRQKNKKS